MKLLPALVSTTLLLLPATQRAQTAGITNVQGAPFTATWKQTKVELRSWLSETRTLVATAQLARDKNGSTYEAMMSDGSVTSILIIDVPKNRKIEIHPKDSTYFYLPINAPEGKLRTLSMEECSRLLQDDQMNWTRSPDHPSDGLPRWHFTALGCRHEKDLNLCGVRDESTSNTGEEHKRDTWRSDLGLVISTVQKSEHFNPPVKDLQALTSIEVVTNLQREEPDPKLFEIPAGYAQIPTPPQYLQPLSDPREHPSSLSQ